MIEKTTGYKVGDAYFATLSDAQIHELCEVFGPEVPSDVEQIASRALACKDRIINILTTGPRSHPKARKANGATRKKRVAAVPDTTPA